MANRRISHARGKGSINHNNRNHIYRNVDSSKTENNVYYARQSLDEAYQHCFGQALLDYNTKQKRADRKIDNYYTHLFGNARQDVVATSSNKEKSFYEIVVGIGDRNTCAAGSPDGELAARILDEYARGFQERNPNFYVFNSVMHMDEKTPHLHIDYVPVADGYKNGMAVRNSQSVALRQMGFGKDKNSINAWRIHERQILRELCQKYGLEIAEESQGRGKTFTPDEYKKMRDEAKDELRADPDILDEVKDEIRADVEDELLSEQQHLVDEIAKHKGEALSLMDEQDKLREDVKKARKDFSDMQTKFKPRKDDLDRVNKIIKEAKPSVLGGKISITKEDWAFIVNIAKQHARISDTTLAALENHAAVTETLEDCQRLYLAVATEVAALGCSHREQLKHRVQDVLKGIEDWRVVAFLMDDMVNRKPSDLDEILEAREAGLTRKHNFAQKLRDYNQPSYTPKQTKTKSRGGDAR